MSQGNPVPRDTTSAERTRCERCGEQVIPLIPHPCVEPASPVGPQWTVGMLAAEMRRAVESEQHPDASILEGWVYVACANVALRGSPVRDPAPPRLAEIEARLEAAIPGPWRTYVNPMRDDGVFVGQDRPQTFYPNPGLHGRLPHAVPDTAWCIGTQIERPTAEFIAHAPDDIRYLLDLVRGVRDPSPPEPCEKCDSVHADWLDTPYPHSIQNPLPTCREAGFKHKPDPMDALEIQKQFAGHRWVVGYMPIEENPWGVHGPMDDGREHVYPIAWLSTRQQAESVAYTLEAYAGVRGAGVVENKP